MTIEYLTGKDYPWLCDSCRATITSLASEMDNMDDLYTSDEEGPCNIAYDNGMFCEGHRCKESG